MFLVLLVGAVAIITAGCAGPRTASVGYKNSVPILTTNMVGSVTASGVEGQPKTLTTTTNWSVVSTPPVPKQTWRERVFGQRPPGATAPSFIPPFPNEESVSSPQRAVTDRGNSAGYGRSGYRPHIYRTRDRSSYLSERASLGQRNLRANLPRPLAGGGRESLGIPNPRANLPRR